jgi:internalin A
LQYLNLADNQLKTLPEAIEQLSTLTYLDLQDNGFENLPRQIFSLVGLDTLKLSNNELTTFPPEIGNLVNLQDINGWNNKIENLPQELCKLSKLTRLDLGSDNSLNPALKSAYEAGLDELKAYLRSLENAEPLYEAKLVLVGEGNVGKTTLLKAL